MAHNINGNRFISRDVPAWHGIGTVFTESMSAVEGLKLADADFTIEKRPLVAQIDRNTFLNTGEMALVREPLHDDNEYRYLGNVSQHYELLQNSQLAMITDQLVSGGNWRLETIGVLGMGETIFFVVEAESFDVAGDEVKHYFLLTDKRDGKAALILASTPVRVVCANTLAVALTHKSKVSIRHSAGMLLETSWRVDVVRQAKEAGKSVEDALRRLAKITVNETKFSKVLDQVFKLPKAPATLELKGSNIAELVTKAEQAEYAHEWRIKTAKEAKAEVLLNFEYNNDTFPDTANTGWSAYNALTGYIDHQMGRASSRDVTSVFGKGDDLRNIGYKSLIGVK